MRLFPASLILAFAAIPATAQQYTDSGNGLILPSTAHNRIENFASCVVRANTIGAAAYVRTKYRSADEREALEKLAPAYTSCNWHLSRWGGTYAHEAMKREAILVALHRYRSQLARRN